MPGGSSTDSTGKSPLKATLVTPRAKAAVPITLLERNGLSAPDAALVLSESNSNSSASLTHEATLRPSALVSLHVAVYTPAISRSPHHGSEPSETPRAGHVAVHQ